MSSFERLHPALQHHIVNSLGWRELRPLQEASIAPILDGKHALLLAPTAGGKTESAIFPVLSRMLAEEWSGLSVLYVCPLKALLNNLQGRLERYATLVGRTCGLWHGDVDQARRQKILWDTPDVLLTTPESLEAMLVSRRVEHRQVFSNLRAVIIDEIHAFAGDDRGWHLLAVLERLRRLARVEPQRIGLSATVGNPEELLTWLAGHCQGQREVVIATGAVGAVADVEIDYVGSLENAATVISRMHHGEKRLVFCDSRSRVEQLGAALRSLGVETYLSHSSLGLEERRSAEAAFSEAVNCVIVATSTLELGIDVGNLDRVIQIDAPRTVASFLQRLGRTGRREGSRRNCLFLATREEALHQTIALVDLWREGFVEPIRPPRLPFHLLAQQLLALVLQEGGVGRATWAEGMLRLPVFGQIPEADREAIVAYMLEQGVLHEDQGILSMGQKGEAEYGYRYFSELLSVFTTSPVFTVLHGQKEIGSVDQGNFLAKTEAPRVLALGGRSWRVVHLDWRSRRAHVEPDIGTGRTRWFGDAGGLGFRLCQRMQEVLEEDRSIQGLSRRATEALQQLRAEYAWAARDATVLRVAGDGAGTEWWTFGGLQANRVLLAGLAGIVDGLGGVDDFAVHSPLSVGEVLERIQRLDPAVSQWGKIELDEDSEKALKFAELLPERLRHEVLMSRWVPEDVVAAILKRRRVVVSG
ncbi:MAG: DEAD/DEAH box helicase [Limisphaerales bacterium]